MALTRKFLSALGIEADKIDEIITAHTEVTDALKQDRDKYKADAERVPELEAEIETFKKAQEKGEKDPYKVKYEAIKEEFEAFKNDVSAKETKNKKESAYKQLLKDAGVSEKRIDAVLKVSDVDGIEFDDDGKVKDADKLTEGIKKEWADFIQTKTTEGANVANPPSTTSNKAKTKEEIMKIKDTTERQQAWKDFIVANQQKGN